MGVPGAVILGAQTVPNLTAINNLRTTTKTPPIKGGWGAMWVFADCEGKRGQGCLDLGCRVDLVNV